MPKETGLNIFHLLNLAMADKSSLWLGETLESPRGQTNAITETEKWRREMTVLSNFHSAGTNISRYNLGAHQSLNRTVSTLYYAGDNRLISTHN